jgi:hypothetical protein
MVNVPPLAMAVTLGYGLQKHQVGWQLHWRMANVPPLAMAVTVAGRLQKHQVGWQLRWDVDYKKTR